MNNKKNKILTFGKASCLIWSLIVLAIAVSIVIFVARLKRDHIETATRRGTHRYRKAWDIH